MPCTSKSVRQENGNTNLSFDKILGTRRLVAWNFLWFNTYFDEIMGILVYFFFSSKSLVSNNKWQKNDQLNISRIWPSEVFVFFVFLWNPGGSWRQASDWLKRNLPDKPDVLISDSALTSSLMMMMMRRRRRMIKMMMMMMMIYI